MGVTAGFQMGKALALKPNILLSKEPRAQLTEWHDRDVFPSELAGDGDFLPEAPAMLREHVVGSRRGVVAHLGPDQLDMSIVRHRPNQERTAFPMSRMHGSIPCVPGISAVTAHLRDPDLAQPMGVWNG